MRDSAIDDPATESLFSQDAEAVDALIDAEFDLERVPEHLRRHCERVNALLQPLNDAPVPVDTSLIDLSMVRIKRHENYSEDPKLSDRDAEALDALLVAGYRADRVPSSLRESAQKHLAIADLVRSQSVPVPSNLVDATLQRIEHAGDIPETFEFQSNGRSGFRLTDLISIAAALLIASSLLWPVLSAGRANQIKAACASNLQASALGMMSYASANDGSLPVVTAGLGRGMTWWKVGEDPKHSNSANLYHLARQHYVGIEDLACAGNKHAPTAIRDTSARDWRKLQEVSYSYRIMFGSERPGWGSPASTILLSDRSPVVMRAVHNNPIDPLENSPNHGVLGQHVLRNDGSAQWLESPVLESGDNIWLPRVIENAIDEALDRQKKPRLLGTEVPESLEDAFVGP